MHNSLLTIRNRFRRRWLNEDIPERDYFADDDDEDVSDRRYGGGMYRRRLSPAAQAYNVRATSKQAVAWQNGS